MRKIAFIGLMASALVLSATPAIANSLVQPVKEENDARIIVEFKSDIRELTSQQAVLYQNNAINVIKSYIAPGLKVENRYTNILNGVVLDVPASKVNAIRNLDFVSNVDYDTAHHIETVDGGLTIKSAALNNDDNISAQTMNVPKNTKKGEGILVGILDTGFLLNHYDAATNQTYTHETFTALDNSIKTKLSSADEVAALAATTGFHAKADEGGSLYFNNKVPFYYDYGGAAHNRDDYGKVFNPDTDVYSEISDHGLHVASMAAGNGSYKGIAENAQLALFKVFTEYFPSDSEANKGYAKSTGCFDSAVINALEDASILKCDVLNMSFGSDLNDFNDESIVFNLLSRLKEEGIWSNYAAGNSGKGYYASTAYGGWTTDMIETGILSGSANREAVMTVAAAQADKQYYSEALVINGKYISYTDQVISNSSTTYSVDRRLTDVIKPNKDYEWVKVPNFGETGDYADINVKGKIAVIDRGSNSFAEKVELAAKNGATLAAIINNSSETVRMSFGDDADGNPVTPVIPVVLIAYEDKDNFSGSGVLRLAQNVYVDNLSARQAASFTSDGATFDMHIKPEISTPGHLVKGAVNENEAGELDPTNTTGYDYWSGTSMAAPNYTGAVALLLGEHTSEKDGKLVVDADYVNSVNARTMSTAYQLNDSKGVDASVRIQGAGMVDVASALTSDVYLEQAAGSGKAKIELLNNNDIKEGKINLSFVANNEGEERVFNVNVKVYRPTVYRYERHTNSKEEPSLNGIELQSIQNTLIKEINTTVTIPAGQSTVTLDTIELDAATKAYIEEHFEASCPIEGYVTLTNNKSNRLSIPFLGYYGDRSNALAVEPFNFEKEEGKTYPSALVNGIMDIMGFDKGDFSSTIVKGYFNEDFFKEDDDEEEDSNKTSPLTEWFYNKAAPTGIKGSNGASLSEVNAERAENDTFNIYTPNNNKCNTLFIQQYVMRSISTNVLTITRKADNKVVLTDHMFDTFFGEEGKYMLYKSFCLDDYLSNGLIGHRAYTIIGLFDKNNNFEPYADGEYELQFDYTLTDGSHQTLTYNLIISNESANIQSVTDNGNYLRVRFTDQYLNYVTLGGKTVVNPSKDDLGYYVDLKKSDFSNGRVFLQGTNQFDKGVNAITHTNDEDNITIVGAALSSLHNFTSTKSVNDNTISYELTYLRNNKETTIAGTVNVFLNIPTGYSPKDVKVYDYDADGNPVDTKFSYSGRCINFVTVKGRFNVVLGEPVTLSSIELKTDYCQTIFAKGSTFNKDGLVVLAKYSDGSVNEVLDYTLTGNSTTSVGKKNVTVSYGGKSASYEIEVVEAGVSGLYFNTLPTKVNYALGEELDLAGMVLIAYNNAGEGTVVKTGYTVSTVDMSTAGYKTVTITYNGQSSSFTIYVSDQATLTGIEIVSNPNKTSYNVGEAFNTEGLVVKANYSDGTSKTVTDYKLGGFDNSEAGEKTVTVYFGGKTATFTVNVNAPARRGCGGSIATTSIILSSIALMGAALLVIKKCKID